MCAQGIKWNTTQPLQIGANKDADTLIAGYDNGTVLGEKTETVVGGRGEGVGGLKTEIIAGAQIAAVGGLKFDYNYGMKYDYSFGYKFGRSPMGTVESVGDSWHWDNSHTSTVGTTFFVGAGETATIHAGTIAFQGTAQVGLISNTASLILTAASSTLAFGASTSALTLNATSFTAVHPVQSVIGAGASSVSVTPATIAINAPTAFLNGNMINLGAPPVANPAIDEAIADAAAMFAEVEAEVEAAAAAAEAAAAAAADAAALFGELPGLA